MRLRVTLIQMFKRQVNVAYKFFERPRRGCRPSNHHIIEPVARLVSHGNLRCRPQPSLDPVAAHRVAKLLGDRKTDPSRLLIGTIAGLHYSASRSPRPCTRRGQKVPPALDRVHLRLENNPPGRQRDMPRPFRRLGGQFGTAALAPPLQHLTTALGCHAGPKTMPALAYQPRGLKSPFHVVSPRLSLAHLAAALRCCNSHRHAVRSNARWALNFMKIG